eukprot:129213_1
MSTQTENKSKWNTLKSFPHIYFSLPFVINNNEFMVAATASNLFDCDGDGIYKFNIHKNEWTKIFDYDKYFKCDSYSAAYDNKHKLLYICSISPPKMLSFDLQTSKVTTKTE